MPTTSTPPAPAAPIPTAADIVLVDDLFQAVGMLRRHIRRGVGRPWPAEPLTGAQGEVVRLVRRRPGISVTEAAAEIGVAPNTVSTLVRSLTAAGVIERDTDPADRRVARLTLTPAARIAVEEWRERRSHYAVRAVAELDDEERRALATALPIITRLAERLRPTAADGTELP